MAQAIGILIEPGCRARARVPWAKALRCLARAATEVAAMVHAQVAVAVVMGVVAMEVKVAAEGVVAMVVAAPMVAMEAVVVATVGAMAEAAAMGLVEVASARAALAGKPRALKHSHAQCTCRGSLRQRQRPKRQGGELELVQRLDKGHANKLPPRMSFQHLPTICPPSRLRGR